jgi:CubicO group peptidase (beta-lactamase class C family)
MTTDTPHIALATSTPEAQGIASSAILGFLDAADKQLDALHSFMLLRHGHQVAAGWWKPYAADVPHMLFSLSKSFTSTGVGLAVAEGRLSVDDYVLSFFPDDAPANPDANLKAMRVRHLLSMSTGHAEDTTGHLHEAADGNWPRAFLELPVTYAPGTHFLYNTGATYMLSAIVQKLTGQTLLSYLQPRLFDPLGISGATWETDPRGVNTGGYGLNVKTEDIARFGQLFLQKGMWNGAQVVPAAWVDEATRAHSDNSNTQTNPDWTVGYGYQFWRCRHNAYRGDGAFGQYCIVMPDQDAVIAITSGVADMQAVLNLIWEHLLPAMQPTALPDKPSAQDELHTRLNNLCLPPAQGHPTTPLAAEMSGKTYTFGDNEQHLRSLAVEFMPTGSTLVLVDEKGEHPIAAGYGAWVKGMTTLGPRGEQRMAASGAWTSDDTYVLKMYAYETPFCMTYTCQFSGDEVTLNSKVNVDFGPTEAPALKGHVKST